MDMGWGAGVGASIEQEVVDDEEEGSGEKGTWSRDRGRRFSSVMDGKVWIQL